MNPPSKFKHLDIWWVNLEPAAGKETRKNRPCIIMQSDMMNYGAETIIVAPFLPGHKTWPFVVNVNPSKQNGLDKLRHINLKQMRGIDISRLGQRQGALEPRYFPAIKETLEMLFGLTTDCV